MKYSNTERGQFALPIQVLLFPKIAVTGRMGNIYHSHIIDLNVFPENSLLEWPYDYSFLKLPQFGFKMLMATSEMIKIITLPLCGYSFPHEYNKSWI